MVQQVGTKPQARLSLNTQGACSIDVLLAVIHSWSLLAVAARVACKHTYLAHDSGNNCYVAGMHQLVIVACGTLREHVLRSVPKLSASLFSREQNKTNQPDLDALVWTRRTSLVLILTNIVCISSEGCETPEFQSFISCAKYVKPSPSFSLDCAVALSVVLLAIFFSPPLYLLQNSAWGGEGFEVWLA